MRALWEDMQTSQNRALKLAAALAVFCVIAVVALSMRAVFSAGSLQRDIDRDFALDAAQQRLVTGLAGHDAARVELALQAVLRQAEYGFRYLAVRDTDGSVLAAEGRYESLNRNTSLSPAVRHWLRATLYTAFGDTGLLTLRDGDRTIGSLEYAIGSTRARLVRDEAVDRLRTTGWVGATLALLFGGATLLLLRAALAGSSEQVVTRERSRAPLVGAGKGRVAPSALGDDASDPLPAAFDTLKIGVLDIDAELRVRLINDTAAELTGWSAHDALGQLIYTVFHARDEAGAPIISPAERCAREGTVQAALELRLRPRSGNGRDAMVEARAVPRVGVNAGARMLFQDVSGRISQRDELRNQARVAEGVIDHLLEAVLTTDTAGVLKSANSRALRMFGYTAEEMQRMTVARLLPVPFMNTPGLKLTDYMPGGVARMPKLAGWRKDATTFPAELVVEPMRAGGEDRLVVIIRDITEQMRSQSLAQRLGRLLDSASEEVYIFDAQSLYFIEVNKGARKNLGLKPDQLARMSLASIATDLEPAMLQSYLARLRGGEAEHVTYKANHRRSDGSTYPVEVRLSFSRDEEPPVFMAIALDITEREAAEKRMRQLAHYDALTNLPNRTLLFDRLKQAMHVAARAERQLAVVFMDLDGFKPINDLHGHDAGDSVLQAVADRLNASLRAADTVARFGGDEFVVLAHSIRDSEDAITLAGKIHELFKVPFDIRGEKVTLSTSIGIVLYPADASDAEGLLRHADAAMYEAKQKGRGGTHVFVTPDASAQPAKPKPQRIDLAREIHAGLTSHQFQFQFLPVLGAPGEVVAAMADFYWQHPEIGRVDSRDTLQAARRAGLNAEIENWMLRESASQYRQAQQHGLPPLPVLLPLTGRQWRDPEFPERLLGIMDAVGAPLKLLMPIIDGADWLDAADGVQMLWPQLLQHGLRIAVRSPDPEGTLDGIALVVLTLQGTTSTDEAQILALLRRYQRVEQPVLLEGLNNAAQWDLLRKTGARYACGSSLQQALTPLEFAVWSGSREAKPL
ncbi:MAG: diguanylate cyclase [Stagnimonas sp.]|nr:diguanylate cyclase [Stagnimonas sp.]